MTDLKPCGTHAENRITPEYAGNRVVATELLSALRAMRRAFCDPMTRRALGGHNEEQMTATLAASAAIAKAEGVLK